MMEIVEKTVNVDGGVEVAETFIVKGDAGELCRLCANTDNQLIPIYRGEGLEHHISVKIEKHLPIIKVTEVDKLPLQICYQCASTLISWHNLYEGCLVADKRLREILSIDEKLCQEDESFGDYVDDYRDNYDDDTHETLPTSTNTSNLESNTSKDNSTVIPILSDTKVFNETDLEGSDERALPRDIRILEEDLIYDEFVANSSDESLSSVSTDLEPITSDNFMCDMCGQIFQKESALITHEKTHRQDDDPGGVETDEEYLLNENDLVHSGHHIEATSTSDPAEKKSLPYMCKNSNDRFECTICHKSFQLKSQVREHYFRLHCGCELLQCSQCKFTSYSKSALDVHLIKCHTKRYTCERCGKMFPYKYQLMTHINGVHLNIRNHTCDLCGKSFKTRANFDTHMARHKDIRNFPCPHCDHRSRCSHDLNVHLRKHTGEKPYVCDICGKAFACSINRIKHQKNIHEPSRTEELTEMPAQQSFTRDNIRIKYQRIVHSKSQAVELDRLQFPDNELADE